MARGENEVLSVDERLGNKTNEYKRPMSGEKHSSSN